MRHIVEYVGGSKGDMVCRFLNREAPSMDKNGKTLPLSLELKMLNPFDYTLELFEKALVENEYEYMPAHPMWYTNDTRYMDLMKKHKYDIISIKFEQKHYTTISIENMIKNKLPDLLARLDEVPDFAYKMRAIPNNLFNEMLDDRKLLHYEDLFCSDQPFPHYPHRRTEWLSLVQDSWCDFHGHGYREFKLPKTFDGTRRPIPMVEHIEKYLSGFK